MLESHPAAGNCVSYKKTIEAQNTAWHWDPDEVTLSWKIVESNIYFGTSHTDTSSQ